MQVGGARHEKIANADIRDVVVLDLLVDPMRSQIGSKSPAGARHSIAAKPAAEAACLNSASA